MHAVVQTLIFADISSGLGINGLALLSQIISFGIVFVLLSRWGFPVIIRTLDRRQATIREGVENAERARRELAEANAHAEEILAKSRRQAQDTIERAEISHASKVRLIVRLRMCKR